MARHFTLPGVSFNPKFEDDERLKAYLQGLRSLSVLFGVGGLAMFAYNAYKKHRVEGEAAALQDMFDEGTTVAQLQDMAAAGKPLPPVVVVRGELNAADCKRLDRGDLTARDLTAGSIVSRMKQPASRQHPAIFTNIARCMRACARRTERRNGRIGKLMLPALGRVERRELMLPAGSIRSQALLSVPNKELCARAVGLSATDEQLEEVLDNDNPRQALMALVDALEDRSRGGAEPDLGKDAWGNSIGIRQLLLTRLSVSIVRPKRGGITSRISKKQRSNVASGRREAEGLHFVGMQGGSAAMMLPALEAELSNATPSLFLAAQEENIDVDGSSHRIDHMSKFVVRDTEPRGDLPRAFLHNCEKELGRLVDLPCNQLWRFQPDGYYDGRQTKTGGWDYFSNIGIRQRGLPSFYRTEHVTPKEFLKRAQIAADENNKCLLQPTFTL
jgi:hypothetical protein